MIVARCGFVEETNTMLDEAIKLLKEKGIPKEDVTVVHKWTGLSMVDIQIDSETGNNTYKVVTDHHFKSIKEAYGKPLTIKAQSEDVVVYQYA